MRQTSIASSIKLLPTPAKLRRQPERAHRAAFDGVMVSQSLDGLAARLEHYFQEAEKSFAALTGETQHLPPGFFLSKTAFLEDRSSFLGDRNRQPKRKPKNLYKARNQSGRKFDRLIAYLNETTRKDTKHHLLCFLAAGRTPQCHFRGNKRYITRLWFNRFLRALKT